ncbi:MAG: ABC transporter permease [Verrucomicrobia bacterium]|nr:ABC transporter permease [Verrucomicrobiota bacterium]
MRVFLTLVRRELGGYFASLTGYLIIALVALMLGLSFTVMLEGMTREPSMIPLTELFFSTPYFWLIVLFAAPAITMRSFALERFAGTYETLMTTPVGDWQVVLAKFTGAFFFYLILWLPLAACLLVVQRYSRDAVPTDPGLLAATLLGLLLLGAVFLSLGCFASSLTRSQIVAAMLSFAVGISLFLLSFLSFIIPPQATWQTALWDQISMINHMQEFARGTVDTRYVAFDLSLTMLFLFLTWRVVESRRWK